MMDYRITKACIIVLAAGKSSRLGRPKQLLEYRGQNLLAHAVSVAIESAIGPVLVVTGANQDAITAALKGFPVNTCYNRHWETGMGTSIRCGVKAVRALYPESDGVLCMVCDQPFIDGAHLKALVKKQETTGLPIVATAYADVLGTPVLFHACIFEALEALEGDKGARIILKEHAARTGSVASEAAMTDIDTETDYENLLRAENAEQP